MVYRMNNRVLRVIICLAIAILAASCVLDEIVVSMTMNNAEPVFSFRYLKASKEAAMLTDIAVYEAKTKKLVWEISTYHPSLYFIFVDGTLEGKRVPRKVGEIPPHEVKFVQMSELAFGAIPDGFKQYVPADNKKPILAQNVDYILSAGGATGGRILFSMDGKCRRLSSTSLSEGHPLFRETGNCLPP
jgi:hypothetical protein